MRVVYVSKALTVAAYRGKVEALAREVDVTAVVPERWGRATVEGAGARLERLPAWLHGHNHFHFYRGAGALLDRLRPDLVHIDEEPFSVVTLQIARLCRARAIPCLFFAWQNLPKRLPPPFRALRERVFAHVVGGIAGTPAAARVLRRGGFRGPLAVIPQFGVDPERFAPDAGARLRVRRRMGLPEDAFVAGFAGRLVAEKGVEHLVAALAAVPEAYLLVIGDGPRRAALERLADRLLPGVRARFAGGVPSLDMAAWLNALDVLALPSLTTPGWSEQFGRVLVEAMACGVPLVASRSGEIPHVVGDVGVLVPEADVAALAAALAGLAAAPARRAELGRLGRRRVLDRFTHQRIADRTAAFYRSLSLPAVPA